MELRILLTLAPRRVAFLAALLLIVAANARAYRVGFVAVVNGTPKKDASVCMVPAGKAIDPFSEMFAATETRCWPVSDVLDVPPGRWNVYAKADGFISDRTILLTYDGPAAPEAGYHELQLPLVASATVDFSGLKELGAIYVPATASALPVPLDARRVTIPAGVDVIPLLIRDGRPVAIGDTIDAHAGETYLPRFRPPASGTFDLIGWLDVDRSLADVLRTRKMPPALLEITDGRGAKVHPIGEPVPHHGLIIARDLAGNAAEVNVIGDYWSGTKVTIARNAPLVVHEAPVHIVPASVIDVDWSVDAASIRPSRTSCGDPAPEGTANRLPPVEVRLLDCPGVQGGIEARLIDTGTCREVRKERTADFRPAGKTTFTKVPAGAWVVEVVAGQQRNKVVAPVGPFEIGTRVAATVSIAPAAVFGRVSRNGAPVAAVVAFSTGRAATDPATGEYRASVTAAPNELVRVRPCDGSPEYVHVFDAPPQLNSAVDIAIPDDEVRVTVADAASKAPIRDASVFVKRLDAAGKDVGVLFVVPSDTSETGEVAVRQVQVGRRVKICATRTSYAVACSEPLVASETPSVRLELQPMAARVGKIVPAPNGPAAIGFVSADGRLIENLAVGPDGTFAYSHDLTPGEYAVVTGEHLPLFVSPIGPPLMDGLNITIPPVGARSIEVSIAPDAAQSNGLIAVAVGGLRVPPDLFSIHQTLHGQQPAILGRGPLVIADIMETGPIVVTLGSFSKTAGPSNRIVFDR